MNEFISMLGEILIKINETKQIRKYKFMFDWKKEHGSTRGLTDGFEQLKTLGLIIIDDTLKCPSCGKIIPTIFLPRDEVIISMTKKGEEYIDKIKDANKVLGEMK